MKLLVILVIVLAVIAVVQLTKVYELSRSLRKTDEDDYDTADNRLNANMLLWWMFIFFGLVIFLYVRYGDYLPDSASEHGNDMDWLMHVNLWMLTVMFFVMNTLLYTVAWKYHYKKGRKVLFLAHDNRLEMVWTLIPGVTMAFIIVFGLITWNKMTEPASEDALQIEIYSKQFDWTARYKGEDNAFGMVNVNLITTDNAMGMVTRENIAARLVSIDEEIQSIKDQLAENKKVPVLPESYVESLEDKIYKLERHKQRLMDLKETKVGPGISDWEAGFDDQIIKGEVHIPVGQEVEFIFRSQDVIHSAYMPHFRAQMNTVPGLPTRFKMTPTITTKEMRQKLKDDEFDYVLLCNKVCGAAHFNMQMKVVVETPEEYAAWLKTVKPYKAAPAEVTPAATEETPVVTAVANN
ncbi:MAG TPA: cytochrome c oxidase subunit II [Flavobacteriales bacterium]